jgi:hypothetical protein
MEECSEMLQPIYATVFPQEYRRNLRKAGPLEAKLFMWPYMKIHRMAANKKVNQ